MIAGAKNFFILLCIFFSMFFCANEAHAALKINDLVFDNSDNMILVKSSGLMTGETAVTKGVLYNPGRVFFDIPDAVLTTPQKTWNFKNSDLEEVKISQFSVAPDVVRVVVRYKINKTPQNFDLIERNGQLILKHSNNFVEGSSWETAYRNFEDKTQLVFESAKGEIVAAEPVKTVLKTVQDDPSRGNITVPETNLSRIFEKNISLSNASALERERKLTSRFFAAKATSVGGGIMLSGIGNINLKPAMFLEEPTRLVIDIQNAVLAQNLRNRTLLFTPAPTAQTQPGETARQSDVLRLGQFDKNTVRLVIQGDGAKDYRTVIAPDLQNLFIAKKMTILNAKLTQNSAKVESLKTQTLDPTLELLTINFTSPIAFSVFEEGKALHFDMQNVGDFNKAAYEEILKNPKFANTKLTRFAIDKTRLSFPLKDNISINIQISNDGKSFRIYFKETSAQASLPETSVIERPRVIELPKLARPTAISNYYKVVLDSGHGGSDTGAIRENINEKDINLPITKMVRDILLKQKVDVHMVMETDKTVSLSQRVEFANEINPDIYVSIHANSSLNEAIIGIETHWYRSESYDLARKVHGAFTHDKNLKKWDTKDRGLFKSQFYVINHTKMPAILCEIGFMSNPNELRGLTDKKRQQEIAQAIADGIMDYLKTQR